MSLYDNKYNGIPQSDFHLEVSRGRIHGCTPFNKFGRNPDIDSGSAPEDIWSVGGDFTGFPTTAGEPLEIYSTSANDTNGGTGAQTVLVSNLLDDTGAQLPDQIVTLNGTTPVSLGAQAYYRGGSVMYVLTSGSSGANEGDIQIRQSVTTANIMAEIPAGFNRTAVAVYTVPLGKTLYINRISIQMSRDNGGTGSANVTLRARPFGLSFQTLSNPELTDSHGYAFENNGYYQIPERTDIKIRCESVSDNNTIITAEASGFLKAN